MCVASNLVRSAFLVAAFCFACQTSVVAQVVSELPRAEYYLARELFGAARIQAATEGFQTAIANARREGDQRWIDSIPPLVMLGECYYQQGSLARALEQYDTALMLALSNPGWIDQMEVGVEQLPALDGVAKGIDWFPRSTRHRPVAIPDAVQLAIDPTQAQVGAQGGIVAPVSLVTRLDATEVLRTLGVALVRRWQILGPLAKHSPLTGPVAKYFLHTPAQSATWVNSAWLVLRGISKLSTGVPADSTMLIRSGQSLGNQFDYFMSSRALLTLAELDAQSGNYQAAIVSLQDAALIAAQYEQHVEMAESLRLLSAYAAASGRIELADPLQRSAAWCSKRSLMSQVAATNGAFELAIYGNNLVQAEKWSKQSSAAMQSRDISMPRDQSQLAFLNSLLAFARNRGTLGRSQLDVALNMMHGSAETGAVVESVFQTQMTLDLLAGGALTLLEADSILATVLNEPGYAAWQNEPLKTLAAITTSSLPAYERFLELAVLRGDQEQVMRRLDRLQCQRLYESLPLGGRLLNWRAAVATAGGSLPVEARQIVEPTLQRFPEMKNVSDQIAAIVAELRQGPLPLDDRPIPGDSKKRFAELSELSVVHESQLAFQTLLRKPLNRFLPEPADLGVIQQRLKPGDLVLAFATTSQTIIGIAVTENSMTQWRVADPNAVDQSLQILMREIGLVREQASPLPSTVLASDASWRVTSGKLLDALFPDNIQALIRQANRLVLAPNDRLWYIPFEMLPTESTDLTSHWIDSHEVTYIPTLGCISKSVGEPPAIQSTVGIVGSFFSIDKETNEQLAKDLLNAAPNSVGVYLGQKTTVLSPVWLKLKSEQLLVASRLDKPTNGWDSLVMPLEKTNQATFGSWLDTPQQSPSSVLLPGMQTSLSSGQPQNGNDIFLPACSLMFSGTRTALLSRWPVGGNSSVNLLTRYLEELPIESSASALRRAVLATWPENFLIANEPILLPAGKENAALCAGSHPLLWGGYMALGDTLEN